MNKRIKKKKAQAASAKEEVAARLKIMPKVHTPPRIPRPIKGPPKRRNTEGEQ